MTVSTVYKPAQYIGNSVTTIFSFPYTFYDATDLSVTSTVIATGVSTSLILNTDYTVSGGNGGTGDVTLVSAPSSTIRITIERSIPYVQETDYVENQAFPADTLETDLDKVVIMAQQVKERSDRALVIPPSDSGSSTVIPDSVSRAGKALFFDASGNPSVTSNVDTVSAAAAAASASAAASSASAASASASAAALAASGIKISYAKAATTANITLSGAQTIDGVSCVAGDRVLVKNQTSQPTNGVYIVAAGSWSRATEADSWTKLVSLMVAVEQGSTQADYRFICTSDTGGTLGVSNVVFDNWSGAMADNSLGYSKIKTADIATTTQIGSGTANKLIDAAGIAPLFYATRVYQTTGQALTTGALRTLSFDGETYDNGGWHSNVTNNSRITVPDTGRYGVIGSVGGLPTSGNDRLELHKNGTLVPNAKAGMTSVGGASPNAYSATIIDEVECTAGDYLELKITVGSNWTTDVDYTKFIVKRVK